MKPIKSNPNYLIDECGNVFSIRRNKQLSPKRNWDGYLRIQLWSNNKNKYVSIHRLVAETFIPNPENKPFVNHVNGDKTDNRVENLEWCTQKENIQHAHKNGLSKPQMKNDPRRSKPVNQYTMNGEFVKYYPSVIEAYRQTNIHMQNIHYAAKGENRSAGGYRWRYCETSND